MVAVAVGRAAGRQWLSDKQGPWRRVVSSSGCCYRWPWRCSGQVFWFMPSPPINNVCYCLSASNLIGWSVASFCFLLFFSVAWIFEVSFSSHSDINLYILHLPFAIFIPPLLFSLSTPSPSLPSASLFIVTTLLFFKFPTSETFKYHHTNNNNQKETCASCFEFHKHSFHRSKVRRWKSVEYLKDVV